MDNISTKNIKCSNESRGISPEDLQIMLCKKLLKQLSKDFYQSASEDLLQMHNNPLRPPEMQLQGSAADGFLINRFFYKSDIDFLHSLTLFNSSLTFCKIISDSIYPAHVKIEVVPNISDCKTDVEKEKIISNTEYKDGLYFLNIEHIKYGICEQVKKRLEKSTEFEYVIKCEKDCCFRVEFNYHFNIVIINQLTDQVVNLTEFSECILKSTEYEEIIKRLFYNLSGKLYFTNQYKWQNFEGNLKSSYVAKPQVSSTNSLKNQQVIIQEFHFFFKEINNEINGILKKDIMPWRGLGIIEDCEYLFLLILINCGLDTIVDVITDKLISVGHQNNHYRIIFCEEEITNIITNKLNYILNESTTQEQNEIKQIFYDFMVKIGIKVTEYVEERKMQVNLKIFSFNRMEDLNGGVSQNKLHWLSSMIKILVQLLEIVKFVWTSDIFIHPLFHHHTMEIVPGLNFPGWPLIASEWITRERYWPEQEIIKKIINNGYHVVFKSLNVNNGYDARFSFSEAETIVCQAMTRDQIIIYNFLKNLFKLTGSKNLKSYYIKTLCFSEFELKPIHTNSKNIQHKYLQNIIKNLCTALKEHNLQHYFIPQHNLFIELKNEELDEIHECLWTMDTESYEHKLAFMDNTLMRQDAGNFFKLVENLFFKTIDATFKI